MKNAIAKLEKNLALIDSNIFALLQGHGYHELDPEECDIWEFWEVTMDRVHKLVKEIETAAT
jgi:hypothetical protein